MYAGDLGPGHQFELLPPTGGRGELLYGHEYVAGEMSRRIHSVLQPYQYVDSQPVVFTDPLGLEATMTLFTSPFSGVPSAYKGLMNWLYTGEWDPTKSDYQAAVGAGGKAASDVWHCYTGCMLEINKSAAGVTTAGAGGAAHLSFTHSVVPKPKDFNWTGIPKTTRQHILAERIRRLGQSVSSKYPRVGNYIENHAEILHRKSRNLTNSWKKGRRGKLSSSARSFTRGVVITESCFSIFCSTTCGYEELTGEEVSETLGKSFRLFGEAQKVEHEVTGKTIFSYPKF